MLKTVRSRAPRLPARLALVVDGRFLAASPVCLTGEHACVRLEPAPRTPRGRPLGRSRGPVRLFVDWEKGGTTELAASLERVDGDGLTTHLDLHGVAGDWRSFLSWLGRSRRK
jgi:hypothetical protein